MNYLKPVDSRHTGVGDFSPQTQYAYDAGPGPAITVTTLLATLRREWRWPIFGCLIGLMCGLSYALAISTPYKSSARILVDRSVNRYLQSNKILDQPIFDQTELESQIHILMSESIVIPVIRSLDLIHDADFVGPPHSLPDKILWNVFNLITIFKEAIGWNTSPPISPDAVLERMVVETFLKRLNVTREDVANVITVTLASQDPNKAASIANAVADTYLAATMDAKTKSTRLAGQWLQDRLTQLKTQAKDADRELQNYKIANNLVNTDKGSSPSEQLATLRAQLANARMAMADAKARYERIQQTIKEATPTATVSDALSNSVIVRLRSQYLDLSANAAEIEARAGP